MKTAETQMTTIQQIKSIISPVRVLKVKEFGKISGLMYLHQQATDSVITEKSMFIHLLSRYESLTSQPLRKEMFVCEVEKPDKQDYQTREDFIDYGGFYKDLADYQAALKKIWFEGFEELNRGRIKYQGLDIDFIKGKVISFTFTATFIYKIAIINPTVSDLIYHISKFNETASKPVEINVTDSFINELIK